MWVRKVGPGRKPRAAVLLGCTLAFGAWSAAEPAARGDAPPGAERHPQPGAGAMPAPAGVPAAYVFTHHGWFHPSCVVRLQSDEVVGADLVVRGKSDGATRYAFAPCAYARFDAHGRALGAGSSAPPVHAAPQPAAAIYDGYIVYYEYDGSITPGSTLVTEEIVPPPPTTVANQDIAFFNDILTSAGSGDILQPVLDFNGETRGKWSIESEHCCLSNNDMQTTPVVVAPGDLIRGTVTGSGCGTNGVCSAWSVTTADVTTGKSTTLNTTAPDGVPNGVSPGSLETYGVMSCDMFPAGGQTTFTGNTLTDPGGNLQTLKYRLIDFEGVDAEVPTDCGYGGKTSGDSFTLIYGKVPAGSDGGTSTGGAAGGGPGGAAGGHSGAAGQGGASGHGGAAVGGRAGTGGSGAGGKGGAAGQGSGGATNTGGAKGTGGATDTGGTTGSGGVTSTGGATGSGSGGATGSGGAAGARGTGGAVGAGGSSGDSSDSGGCSCSTEGRGGVASVFSFLMTFMLAGASTRARRRRRA